MSCDRLRAACCHLRRQFLAHFLGDESETLNQAGLSVFEASALLYFTFSWPFLPIAGASEIPLFTLSLMETSPSPPQTPFPSLYATKSGIANSCFPLRLLTVPKQKRQEYFKGKFEPEAEQEQQEQAKISQIFCTKGTSELHEKISCK